MRREFVEIYREPAYFFHKVNIFYATIIMTMKMKKWKMRNKQKINLLMLVKQINSLDFSFLVRQKICNLEKKVSSEHLDIIDFVADLLLRNKFKATHESTR